MIKDELILITGGGSGIGAALALRMAVQGYQILITGRRKAILNKIQAKAPDKIQIQASDISSAKDRKKLLKYIENQLPLKYVIHNAAIIEPIKFLESFTENEFKNLMAINLEGPLFLTQGLIPYLQNARILNVSSGAAHKPYAGWGAYCISKAALHMAYQVFVKEFENRNIHFGSIRPGVVDTAMQTMIRKAKPKEFPLVERFKNLKKEGQLRSPDTIARFIEWVLLETDDQAFSREEWNIVDESHHEFWMEGAKE